MQASHKRNYRQQNDLRPNIAELKDRGYRQAMNTDQEIEFKPLPPVKENSTVPATTAAPKLAPLQNPNEETKDDQQDQTRTAAAAPRVPILRATTTSSASISLLRNIENVLQRSQGSEQQYYDNRHIANGSTSSSVEVKSIEETIER